MPDGSGSGRLNQATSSAAITPIIQRAQQIMLDPGWKRIIVHCEDKYDHYDRSELQREQYARKLIHFCYVIQTVQAHKR